MLGLAGVLPAASGVALIGFVLNVMADVVGTGLIVSPLWLVHRFGSMGERVSFDLVTGGGSGACGLLTILPAASIGAEFAGVALAKTRLPLFAGLAVEMGAVVTLMRSD